AVGRLVAAAPVTGGDATVAVASTGLAVRAHQRLLGVIAGDLDEVGAARAAAARRRRLVLTNCHGGFPSESLRLLGYRPPSGDRPSEDVDVFVCQGVVGALIVLVLASALC